MTVRAPICRMIDSVVKCVRCGAPMSQGCNCWDKITLRCPQCKRSKQVHTAPSDPPGTAVVEATCDRCDDGGGFPETHYYDAKGRWFDGETFRKR